MRERSQVTDTIRTVEKSGLGQGASRPEGLTAIVNDRVGILRLRRCVSGSLSRNYFLRHNVRRFASGRATFANVSFHVPKKLPQGRSVRGEASDGAVR
ncbi:unnamed protein product [Lampetra fluviatilis]